MDIVEMLRERIVDEKSKKARAIVFWYDDSAQETLASLTEAFAADDIKVRVLTTNNFFSLKIDIEIEHKDDSFLLYAPFAKLADEDNLLLDMQLYGIEFKADQIAILAEQLLVNDSILRPMIQRYPSFFKSKGRKDKLKKVLPPNASERDIEYSMLAVLANSPVANMAVITRHLLVDGLDEQTNMVYKNIEKHFSTGRMWILLTEYFGMGVNTAHQSLQHLLEYLLVAHFQRNALFELTSLGEKYATTRGNACALFIDDWLRAKESEVQVLEMYVKNVENTLQIRELLQELPVEQYDAISTFPLIDVLIIEKVTAELLHQTSDLTAWNDRLQKRLKTHWARRQDSIAGLYQVMLEAVRLTEYKTYVKEYDTRENLYVQYTEKLYLVDQAYRRFMLATTQLEHREYVGQLVELLTNWYENNYLRKLVEETNHVLENETAINLPKQQFFFNKTIQPIIDKESTRVFVIISDALRFEVGIELTERLNKRANGAATVSPMMSSLPSYTQLGMASLLPHRTLSISDNKTVMADGLPTNGLANRTKVLQQAHESAVAYRLDEMLDWSPKEADEYFKGKRVVYLYHDIIDATGDSIKSERETYAATERAIELLQRAIDRLSRLQAKRIFVTADHGFLFQYSKIGMDVKVEAVQGDIVESNRRFAIGKNLQVPAGAVKLNDLFTPLKNVEVVIAKGVNRFIGGGGLQFVHGGAMPQEVVIPLIDYRRISQADLVDISVAMPKRIITNFRIQVPFYQEQSVSISYLPRTVKAALYIEDERVSDEIECTFNFTGDNHERRETLTFNMVEKYYESGQVCTLKLMTIEDDITTLYTETPFTIHMYNALY
ncbi:BREX-1 system phosphatase PglZ type A [Sporosarcina sp. E16_8]|uniref:BREX-1 system phosphatase PglZ type A n=1 Tax=Sporosarcina sp. E16_8 TaxID=2789295 RepID=UPI001A932E5D|nr:BREX-1 system phosphatase PglZ type A [Sporosarcina sp. E16_8]MBO0587706.1 BREX-1 system phosphatase PglZ type A [Sporosarcina sp. E16_8]